MFKLEMFRILEMYKIRNVLHKIKGYILRGYNFFLNMISSI